MSERERSSAAQIDFNNGETGLKATAILESHPEGVRRAPRAMGALDAIALCALLVFAFGACLPYAVSAVRWLATVVTEGVRVPLFLLGVAAAQFRWTRRLGLVAILSVVCVVSLLPIAEWIWEPWRTR
jgi:hypothetical protein